MQFTSPEPGQRDTSPPCSHHVVWCQGKLLLAVPPKCFLQLMTVMKFYFLPPEFCSPNAAINTGSCLQLLICRVQPQSRPTYELQNTSVMVQTSMYCLLTKSNTTKRRDNTSKQKDIQRHLWCYVLPGDHHSSESSHTLVVLGTLLRLLSHSKAFLHAWWHLLPKAEDNSHGWQNHLYSDCQLLVPSPPMQFFQICFLFN